MQILKARFHNREEFNEVYHRDLPNGGMFVATTTPLSERDPVVVELFVKGLPGKVLLRGEVKSWRPALPRLRVRAGALVEFLSIRGEISILQVIHFTAPHDQAEQENHQSQDEQDLGKGCSP